MALFLDSRLQKDLWKHMYKKSEVPLCNKTDYENRQTILERISKDIDNGIYTPQPIHGYITSLKGNNVARFIPVFSYEDIAVYFGCIKVFDQRFTELAVPGTFGGWSLGGARRNFEKKHACSVYEDMPPRKDYFDEYTPISSFNRNAWFENWQKFWQLSANLYEHACDSDYFALFDIANFYDSIDLPKLERQIRACSNENDSVAVEVLFYFLSIWNKKQNQYAKTTKGIPQDNIGDCSRVLANFYLVPFDKAIKEKSEAEGCKFTRFADDMILVCPDYNKCKNLIFQASRELHKLGLNINSQKVKILTKAEFGLYWGFDIMDKLTYSDDILSGLEILREKWNDKGYKKKTIALKCAIGKISEYENLNEWKKWIYDSALNLDGFILNLNFKQLTNLIRLMPDPIISLRNISDIIINQPFTQPKISLLHSIEDFMNYKTLVFSIKKAIENVNDNVVNLVIKNRFQIKYESIYNKNNISNEVIA
jgi:hypothetical protein